MGKLNKSKPEAGSYSECCSFKATTAMNALLIKASYVKRDTPQHAVEIHFTCNSLACKITVRISQSAQFHRLSGRAGKLINLTVGAK